MNAVIEWVKANVLIVVFVVLMLAAAITLPILSGRLNKGVRAEVSARAQNLAKLTQLEKSEILPGQPGVPNEQTLQKFEQIAKIVADDAANVSRAALDHNRKGRGVLLGADLFPEPRESMDVLPKRFHDALMDAYGNLLAEINAGMPPTLESMRDQLKVVHQQFYTQDLKKDLSQPLDAEEQKRLTQRMSDHRMAICVEGASKTGLFVSTNELGVPVWVQASPPSLGELYNWQWQFWVATDVLKALHEANKADATVRLAPVKRVLSLVVSGLPVPADVSQGGQGGGPGPGKPGFGGPGLGDGGRVGGGAEAPAAIGAPLNPKAPVPRNYSASLTGRTTNGLYDVVQVDLDLVVENARFPQVLDALAKYNFITVTGLTMEAADPFAELQDGYFYGTAPISRAHLTLETIWLREWTQQFMPKSIKQVLGPTPGPASEQDSPDE